jgi:hypothetical protein
MAKLEVAGGVREKEVKGKAWLCQTPGREFGRRGGGEEVPRYGKGKKNETKEL